MHMHVTNFYTFSPVMYVTNLYTLSPVNVSIVSLFQQIQLLNLQRVKEKVSFALAIDIEENITVKCIIMM